MPCKIILPWERISWLDCWSHCWGLPRVSPLFRSPRQVELVSRTICPRISDPTYIVNYCIKWVTTFRTYSSSVVSAHVGFIEKKKTQDQVGFWVNIFFLHHKTSLIITRDIYYAKYYGREGGGEGKCSLGRKLRIRGKKSKQGKKNNTGRLHKQGQTVHMLQLFWIYIPLARLYIYIYWYKYIYTYIQIYIHIYLHVLLFNILTTFSFRMLCLKKPFNMDFLK